MNPYKLRTIVEFVRSQGVLADLLDRDVNLDDVMAHLDLDRLLPLHEQIQVKRELHAVIEADCLRAQLEMINVQRR